MIQTGRGIHNIKSIGGKSPCSFIEYQGNTLEVFPNKQNKTIGFLKNNTIFINK